MKYVINEEIFSPENRFGISFKQLSWLMCLLLWASMAIHTQAQTPTVNLTNYQPVTNLPADGTFEWHSAVPVDANNLMTPAQIQSAGVGVYYGVFNFGTCYSAASSMQVVANSCAIPNLDLRTFVDSTAKPAGSFVTFHSDSPTTSTNKINGTSVGAGNYYYAFKTDLGTYIEIAPIVVLNAAIIAAPSEISATPTTICAGDSSVLNAICATGIVTWYSDAALTVALPSTTVSPSVTTTYYAACVDDSCKSTDLSVAITVNTIPLTPQATENAKSNICPTSTFDLVTLQPAEVIGQTYEWHTSSSNPNVSSLVTNLSISQSGSYYLFAKTSTGCYSNASNVVIITIDTCMPCSIVEPGVVSASVAMSNIGDAVTFTLTGATAGTSTAWAITPSNGASINAGTGTNTGSVVFSIAGEYKILFTSTNSTMPVGCTQPKDTSAFIMFTVNNPVVQKIAVSPKVYLQGAIFGVSGSNLMRDDLRVKKLIPAKSPYAAMGLTVITLADTVAANVLTVTGADAIVDWVFVELRSATDNKQIVDSRSALLQRDGDIVGLDGVSALTFDVAQAANYYVVVKHRNHLGVMTKTALALSSTPTTVDFTTVTTPTYTLSSSTQNVPQVTVEQGLALWSGNTMYDNKMIYQGTNNDNNSVYQQVVGASTNVLQLPSYKLKGYYSGDVNMNGEVIFQGTGNDIEFIYQNTINNHTGNLLKQSYFVIKEQLP